MTPAAFTATENVVKRLFICLSAILFPVVISGEPEEFPSHSEVARKVMSVYSEMKTYKAEFTIEPDSGRKMTGTAYYQNPGKLNFDFSRPGGDRMVSDGKTLWIYISRLNIAGKQDLTLEAKDEKGKPIFSVMPGAGLNRLFRKYHYRFDSQTQPRSIDGKETYVLDLVQKEKIGGFETMVLYIDAESYLVRKSVATDGRGRKTAVSFQNPVINPPLDGTLFQYRPEDNTRIVSNPLVEK